MIFLPLELAHLPLYQQIYTAIKKAIQQGSYPPFSKLPSKRMLAKSLSVSVNTVDTAYAQLAAEGYVELRAKSGCYVCTIGELEHMDGFLCPPPANPPQPQFSIDFSPYDVDRAHFPYSLWRKLLKQSFDELDSDVLKSPETLGLPQLRQAICHYLEQSRGIVCNAENIIIGSSTGSILSSIVSALRDNLIFATENPVYNQAFQILSHHGKPALPIGIDKSGLILEQLEDSHADVVYVTPSHQFPLGLSMPIKRRVELLNWAAEKECRYILEDDYDSEFRYSGKPLPPIRSMDKGNKVIYLSTFSRSISPAIKVSYALLPPGMTDTMVLDGLLPPPVSRLEQKVISTFMQSGDFERHINKMRNLYSKKRDLLTQCLKKYNAKITILGEKAGHNILLSLLNGEESQMVAAAQSIGIKVYPVSRYFIGKPEAPYGSCVLLGYGALSEQEIRDGTEKLAIAWQLS